MRLFGVQIPSGQKSTVIECESWTVDWSFYSGQGYQDRTWKHKVFVSEHIACEFITRLREAADFIGCDLDHKMYKN